MGPRKVGGVIDSITTPEIMCEMGKPTLTKARCCNGNIATERKLPRKVGGAIDSITATENMGDLGKLDRYEQTPCCTIERG
jgi:hypothetical protein